MEVKGTLYDLAGFPGFKDEGESVVKGDLFEVDDSVLRRLDMYECHPYMYTRTEKDGFSIYVYNGEVYESTRIDSGDFLQHAGVTT